MKSVITAQWTIMTVTTAIGIGLLAQGCYIDAKAWLAQELITSSWTNRTHTQAPAKPWSWSDMQVIARLRFLPNALPAGIDQYVLNSDSGQALAFGPGHLPGSAEPANPGHSLIAGHRDTHFKLLAELTIGDVIEAEHYSGLSARYRVVETRVLDSSVEQIPVYSADLLSLITCYPFNSLDTRGPLRYLVTAERIEPIAEQGLADEPTLPL